MNDIWILVVIAYFILHIPAFIMLIIGLSIRKRKPETAKILFIITAAYFVIGGGICGSMLL